MIGNCLDGYVDKVASHATGQDDGKITFGAENFHHSKCRFSIWFLQKLMMASVVFWWKLWLP